MDRLRAADRRRRASHRIWFALGGAAFALSTAWALAHSPLGALHWGVVAALTALATAIGWHAGRSAPVTDEALARSVDAGSELPQLALTVITPLRGSPAGLIGAVHGHTEARVAADDTPHRLPTLGIPRWPAIGAVAAILFFLLLPQPPEITSEPQGHANPPRVLPETNDDQPSGDEGDGDGGAAGGAAKRAPGESSPQPQEQAGETGDAQAPQPQPGTGAPTPKPPPPSRKPGDGTSELYGESERLDVNLEKLKVDSLFDEAIDGVKRTVMLPDPPRPTLAPAERKRPRGKVPDEIKRADETALNERITDAAERDTVRRYFEYLNSRAAPKDPKGK